MNFSGFFFHIVSAVFAAYYIDISPIGMTLCLVGNFIFAFVDLVGTDRIHSAWERHVVAVDPYEEKDPLDEVVTPISTHKINFETELKYCLQYITTVSRDAKCAEMICWEVKTWDLAINLAGKGYFNPVEDVEKRIEDMGLNSAEAHALRAAAQLLHDKHMNATKYV